MNEYQWLTTTTTTTAEIYILFDTHTHTPIAGQVRMVTHTCVYIWPLKRSSNDDDDLQRFLTEIKEKKIK